MDDTQFYSAMWFRGDVLYLDYGVKRNAYFAFDATTLGDWLRAGQRVTFVYDERLIKAIESKFDTRSIVRRETA